MSTSRSFHHGDLKAALTDSAVRIVEQSGVETFSLREVARDAGVSSAAPYRHFSSKEALLAEVARRGFDQLHDELAEAGSSSDRRSSFLTRCVAYIGFARHHPALYRLMFGAFPNKHCYDDLVEAGDRLFALLNDSLAVSPSDRAARAIGCWAFVHGLAMLALDNQLRVHLPSEDDESLLAVLQPLAEALMGTATT